MDNEQNKSGKLIGILTMFALYAMAGFVTFLAAPAAVLEALGIPPFEGRFPSLSDRERVIPSYRDGKHLIEE